MKLYTLLVFAAIALMLFSMAPVLAEDDVAADVNDSPADSVIAPAPDTTSADTTTVDSETVAEINDDLNESVSGLRIGWERVKLGLTFNNEKKAMQELKLARLRLVQARVAAKNGNTAAMENALEAHERLMERVKTRVNAIDGASTAEGARLAVEKLVGLERAIEVHEARISKLNEILASENLTEQQRAVAEQRLAKAQENTETLKQVQAAKRENIKTKLRAVTNMTEEEADSAITEIEDSQGLSAVRKLASEVRAERQERIENRLEIRQNVWNNLSDETQQEIRETVRSEIEQRLGAGSDSGSGSGKSA